MKAIPKKPFGTAEGRWAGVGPYYAMFPARFADTVIRRHSEPGDSVLDPFAGRGTSLFSAAAHDRYGIGIEINPVGWVYARTKLGPASKELVLSRLDDLWRSMTPAKPQAEDLPRFFTSCFCKDVRRFLVSARTHLNWRQSTVDRTLMAFLLVYLHGKRTQALSNQMRQTKAMSPEYAIRWWANEEMRAPRIDPIEFLRQRIEWRYLHGLPETRAGSQVYLGSSPNVLRSLRDRVPQRAALLFTSPPYFGLTNYHYDQWLRLWLLGGAPHPTVRLGLNRARFGNSVRYRLLLESVFLRSVELLKADATVYVRTGAQASTYKPTLAALKLAFPKHDISRTRRPYDRPTQTSLFGDFDGKPGEVDLILRR